MNYNKPAAKPAIQNAASPLTHVELTFVPKRIEYWIRFGRIAEERILDRRRRIVSFASGSVFAFVRWASNEHGTIISRIDILRAISPGEAFSTVPFVRPGGDILLRIAGWAKVESVLRAIDAVEAIGVDPIEVASDHWRHVHNRLTVGLEPRPYTLQRPQCLAAAAQGRVMISRAAPLAAMCLGISAAVLPQQNDGAPWLIWNVSASAPVGLYSVASAGELRVTDLVVVKPPEATARFLADRGYLPRGVPLLKRILALPGETVCRQNFLITVDGVEMGEAREHDHLGRALPVWQGCRIIADGEIFFMNWDNPDSYDGRYFGPLPSASIIGRAIPVWTFEDN